MKYCKRIDWDFVICNQVLYSLAKQNTISQRFTKVIAFKSFLGYLLKITGTKICLKDQKLRYSVKMINNSATGKEQNIIIITAKSLCSPQSTVWIQQEQDQPWCNRCTFPWVLVQRERDCLFVARAQMILKPLLLTGKVRIQTGYRASLVFKSSLSYANNQERPKWRNQRDKITYLYVSYYGNWKEWKISSV